MLFPNPVFSNGFIVDIINHADTITYGGLGVVFLMVIFFALFFMMNLWGTEKALTVSSFVTAFLGILLRFFFLSNDKIIYIAIIFFVIFFYLLKSGNDSFY